MTKIPQFLFARRILRQESNQSQKMRRLLTAFCWQAWKRTVRVPITVKLLNGYQIKVYPDCHSSSCAIYFRIPEFREIAFVRQQMNGGVFIDIGANVGMFTLLVADRIGHAILFEPNPIAAARARENLAINGLCHEVQELALSDKNGEVLLEDRGGTDSTNRTLEDSQTSNYPTHRVPCRTFDSFLEEREETIERIDAIKIDVEGHENSVLKGMKRTLTELRPKLVIFEYLQRTNLNETRSLFDSFGYQIYCLDENCSPIPASDHPKPLQNLVALAREDWC